MVRDVGLLCILYASNLRFFQINNISLKNAQSEGIYQEIQYTTSQFSFPRIKRFMFDLQTCQGTNMSGHKRVWVQTCLGTNRSGHKCTNVSGHKRVWAQTVRTQSCGHSRVGTIMYGHKRGGTHSTDLQEGEC